MKAHSKRSCLAAASAGLASLFLGCAHTSEPDGDAIAMLLERSRAANAVLMRGEIEEYAALQPYSEDFTLFSPFGGEPTRGRLPPERMAAMGRFFRDGTLTQEVVQTYGTRDMVVLTIIERAHVAVGGLPTQDWALRVTLVYRREGSDWQLVHRHADPLVAGITLDEAAALGRRERVEGR